MAFIGVPRNSIRWLVAEMLVVILGILIAFQVEEYQSSLNERENERRFLEAIIRDLELGENEFLLWQSALDQNIDRFEILLAHFSGAVPLEESELESIVSAGFTGRLWAPTSPSFTGMKDSGNLSLLSNPTLQSSLTRYFDIVEPYFLERRITLEKQLDQFRDALASDLQIAPSKDFLLDRSFNRTLVVSASDFPTHPDFMRRLAIVYRNTMNIRDELIPGAIDRIGQLRVQIHAHIEFKK